MPPQKRKRAPSLACVSCREKDIPCDGQRPICHGCAEAEVKCQFSTPAQQRRALEDRASEASPAAAPVAEPGVAVAPRPMDSVMPLTNAQLTERMVQMEQRMAQMAEWRRAGAADPRRHNSDGQAAPTTGRTGRTGTTTGADAPVKQEAEPGQETHGPLYKLAVDDEGNVVYFGLTSLCSAPGVAVGAEAADSRETPTRSAAATAGTEAAAVIMSAGWSAAAPLPISRPDAAYDPTLAPLFKAIVSGKTVSVSDDIGCDLLKHYFRYEVLNSINHASFSRDMALERGGPMFSPFLLMSIYAAATGMVDHLDAGQRRAQSELFERLAKEYLARELEGASKTTTAQGLLLLSERALALGNNSKAWNYAGMAFHMIEDLNICQNVNASLDEAFFADEVFGQRQRLFWVAFLWDKILSIALGRDPRFSPRKALVPKDMHVIGNDLTGVQLGGSRHTKYLRLTGELCLILHGVIAELYGSETSVRQNQGAYHRSVRRSARLSNKLGSELAPAVNTAPLLNFALHEQLEPLVFTIEMLKNAMNILIHRHTLVGCYHVEGRQLRTIQTDGFECRICLQSSKNVLERMKSNVTLLCKRSHSIGAYASLIAAAFDLLMLEAPCRDVKQEAVVRIDTWLHIIKLCVERAPGLRRHYDFVSQKAWHTVSRDEELQVVDAGRRVLDLYASADAFVYPESSEYDPDLDFAGFGLGTYPFFDLAGPLAPTIPSGPMFRESDYRC